MILALAAPCVLFPACNDEWTEEQYEKTVAFVKSGYTDIYLKYDATSGVVSYKVPVLVNGSAGNDQNVIVTVALDPDTLVMLNYERFRLRKDLYFKLLKPEHYTLKSETVTIPAGENTAVLDVDFSLQGLDLVDKHILPLQITATSVYEPSPRKWYKKTMMRIVPFNDYSGNYMPTSGNITFIDDNGDPVLDVNGNTTIIPLEDYRDARVVDENTVFFYAGVVEEQARDRARYKVQMRFNPDGTLTLWADDPDIKFTQINDPTVNFNNYSVVTAFDQALPYLEHRYTIVRLDYSFTDVSHPSYQVRYHVQGSLTMERKRNTLIPEEDQQFIFD
jgi:hypothetical protein